jgi:hypothetical protein
VAGHGFRARLGEELRCTGAEEPTAGLVSDRSKAMARDDDGTRVVERQSKGGVGFVKEESVFFFFPWSRQG